MRRMDKRALTEEWQITMPTIFKQVREENKMITPTDPAFPMKSAQEWIDALGIKCEIIDPDGWDRSGEKWDASWSEKILEEEFFRRMDRSTCTHKYTAGSKWCSCVVLRPALMKEYERLGI